MQWWLAAVLVVAVTFPLPWVAVMLGNSKGQIRDERERMVYRPGAARHYMQEQQARQAQMANRQLSQEQRLQLGYFPDTVIDHDDEEGVVPRDNDGTER